MDSGLVVTLILVLGVGVLELVGIFTLPMFFEIRNFKRFAIGLLAVLCIAATAILYFVFSILTIIALIVFAIGTVVIKILF